MTEYNDYDLHLQTLHKEILALDGIVAKRRTYESRRDEFSRKIETIRNEETALREPDGCLTQILYFIGGYIMALPVWGLGEIFGNVSSGIGMFFFFASVLTWIVGTWWLCNHKRLKLKKNEQVIEETQRELTSINKWLSSSDEQRECEVKCRSEMDYLNRNGRKDISKVLRVIDSGGEPNDAFKGLIEKYTAYNQQVVEQIVEINRIAEKLKLDLRIRLP